MAGQQRETQLNQRQLLDALADVPPKMRAVLEATKQPSGEAFGLWCYYGWGVMVNDFQTQLADDVLRAYPPGAAHIAKVANRGGKTTGDVLLEFYAMWLKWRYRAANFDPQWLGYLYKVLHSAPTNRLMGRAHELAGQLISGTAPQQQNPKTYAQRNGFLAPFFEAGKGQAQDGSDELWVKCMNGSKLDFLSTHDGAGRMESESWWLIVWDEWVRHQPVDKVIPLIDQTFLPRSSDFMAPIVLSSTITEEAEPIIGELEDFIEESQRAGLRDWNIITYGRSVNFAQTPESIDRQRRMSINKEAAGRSIDGLSGQGGYGLFPDFTLKNCFTETLPDETEPRDIPKGWVTVSILDHAAVGDENVCTTLAMPWPLGKADLLTTPVIGVSEAVMKSSRSLTPDEIVRFAVRQVERYQPRMLIVDATAEGGQLVLNTLRKTTYHLPNGGRALLPVVALDYSAREFGAKASNKDVALQRLQAMLTYGLPVEIGEDGLVRAWPTIPAGATFGALRLPASWRRTRRQAATYRRLDAKLTQDRLMVLAMGAWRIWAMYDGAKAHLKPMKFNIVATRHRPLMAGGIR